MKISNELLSSYVEGNVSDEEREQVREYLMENPAELEFVMSMMDDDYELEPTSERMEDIVLSDDIIENDAICKESDDSLFDTSIFGGVSLCSSAFASAHRMDFGTHNLFKKKSIISNRFGPMMNNSTTKASTKAVIERMDDLLNSL